MEMLNKILSMLINVVAWLFGTLNKNSSLIFSAFALVVILLYFWLGWKEQESVKKENNDELFEWLEEQYGFDYVDIVEKFVDFQNYLLLYGVAFELNMAPEERSQKEIEEYADKVFNPTLDNYMRQLEERIKSQ